ncbi:MAG TPA: SRPBCC domain-containing protein [Rudaea sp.]|jgi:uncharacterized protein YndB with AHSA1/START domain|nr:SRPBCC domain-containing protein [Rudaea sp.]
MQTRNKNAMGEFGLKIPRTYDAPAAKVFDAWVNPKSVKSWLADGEDVVVDPRVGGLFYLEMPWEKRIYPHYGRYITIDAPRVLEFTWISEGTRGKESVVKIALKETGGKTQLTLTHDGLPDEEQVKNHTGGWSAFLESLAKRI